MSDTDNKQSEPAAAEAPAQKSKFGGLAARLGVAVVAIPLLLLAVYSDYHQIVFGIVFLASLIAMHEFFSMTLKGAGHDDSAIARDRFASVAIGGAVIAIFYWLPFLRMDGMSALLKSNGAMASLVLTFMAPALYYLFRYGDMDTVSRRLAATTTGILYGGVLFVFLALLKRDFDFGGVGSDLILLVLATAWASDTGGYFAGKTIGKHKLYPTVSPNKTWEGSIGGVAAAVGAAIAIKYITFETLPWLDLILLVVPGAILGQMGDLCESLFKRSVGVKDSGSLLPGHGGILDRVDAVLFIAPYFYLYMLIRPLF